jgi:hypothetical protein
LIGHEGARNERLARLAYHGRGHGQALAKRPLRVKAQALGIGHGHQAQREGAGRVRALLALTITDQPLLYPAALRGHCAELGETEGAFVHLGDLLWHGVHQGECHAPLVAGGGPSGRWHLGTTNQ